jgi:hypothetical protein
VRLGPTLTINYVEISDHDGLLTADETISALIVSKGNEAAVKPLNDKLEVFEVEEINANS